jgi:phage shock protein C
MNSKKLTRSRTKKAIAGVCAGLGEYFNIDPIVIRLGFIFLALAGGPGIIVYLIMWLVVPEAA